MEFRACACGRLAARALACMTAIAAGAGLAAAESRVTLVAADGVTLAGSYYAASQRPAPAVLLLHMPTRTRADWEAVAARLAERGVAALAIDFRGHGDSAPAGPTGEPGQSPHAVWLRDVQAAMAWLKGRPDVLPGRVAIAGASLGANLAVLAAADDPAVRALVLLSATLEFRGVRSEAAMRKYGDRPALIVASQEDGYATRSARDLAAAGTGVRDVRLLIGAGHGTTMLQREPDLAATLVDWLSARLL